MAATYVSIANLAASKIGEDDQLQTPGDDTHLGRTVAAVWDAVRVAALRDGGWNFATRRRALTAEVSSEEAYPFTYRHPLPAECLKLRDVLNLDDSQWQFEGDAILCDSIGPVYVRIIIDMPEPATWDDLFVEAMACKLARTIGVRIAGSNYDTVKGEREYLLALRAAKGADSKEGPNIEQAMSGWETARFGC